MSTNTEILAYAADLDKYFDLDFGYCEPAEPNTVEISDYSDANHLTQSNFDEATRRLGLLAGFDPVSNRLTLLDASGAPTPALRELYTICRELADYPILDESDYTERQCDTAAEHGLDFFGDEVFAAWRAGELKHCAGWCGDPVAVPAPDAHPEVTEWSQLPGDSDALRFIEGHAQSRCLDSEVCY